MKSLGSGGTGPARTLTIRSVVNGTFEIEVRPSARIRATPGDFAVTLYTCRVLNCSSTEAICCLSDFTSGSGNIILAPNPNTPGGGRIRGGNPVSSIGCESPTLSPRRGVKTSPSINGTVSRKSVAEFAGKG